MEKKDIENKINDNQSSDKKLMEKYKDKKNVHEIKEYVKNIKSVGGVINYIDSLYKGWIIGFYDTCDPKIEKIWDNTIIEMLNKKKQKIIMVDFIYFDNANYSNINYFADFFTHCGFLVLDKFKIKECDKKECSCSDQKKCVIKK